MSEFYLPNLLTAKSIILNVYMFLKKLCEKMIREVTVFDSFLLYFVGIKIILLVHKIFSYSIYYKSLLTSLIHSNNKKMILKWSICIKQDSKKTLRDDLPKNSSPPFFPVWHFEMSQEWSKFRFCNSACLKPGFWILYMWPSQKRICKRL